MDSLLRCPCCGDQSILQFAGIGKSFPFRVECSNSKCKIRTPDCRLAEAAAAIWNQRRKQGELKVQL